MSEFLDSVQIKIVQYIQAVASRILILFLQTRLLLWECRSESLLMLFSLEGSVGVEEVPKFDDALGVYISFRHLFFNLYPWLQQVCDGDRYHIWNYLS